MWLLTCDGDLFQGKPRWLRPGSTHLLGRTSGRGGAGERIQYIEHKTVSRKHLTIRVSEVKPGDSSRLTVRSTIQVTDGSKVGTAVDGEQLKGETKTLTGKSHEFRLGSYEHSFHLTWRPVVLSFTSLPKKAKDPLARQRELLEQTDIKLIQEYLTNETTHAIAKKRNTVAALQALCQARWLVTEAFVEHLVVATAQRKSNGPDENPTSPLEEDFTLNWPKEINFAVPSATERHPRPDSYLEPNEDRKEIFKDFIFVFLSQVQYDSLFPVITAGCGKALLKDVDPAENTADDVVDYVKEVAGKKGAAEFRLSQQKNEGGIVVVRMNDKDEEWTEFLRNIDLALDQRAVEQNEFLDAILTVDASGLRRRLEPSVDEPPASGSHATHDSRPTSQPQRQTQQAITVSDSPPAEQTAQPIQAPQEEEPAPEQDTTKQPSEEPPAPTMRRNKRVITKSRFKGFDDFDPSQFTRPASGSPEPAANPTQVSNTDNMDVDDPPQAPAAQSNTRKRPAPPTEPQEDMYASILSTHAAVKRQKTMAAQDGKTLTSRPGADAAGELGESSEGKKKAKEMDVMAEMKAIRKQQEEDKRREHEEALRNTEGIDVDDIKATIEEMELPLREPPPRNNLASNAASDRWDPAWNGRKNFKKFRRQGERQDVPRLQRVIVTLEQVPKKGHGLGDEYWLNSTSTGGNRSKSKSQSQSQTTRHSHSQRAGDEDEDDDEDDDENETNARFRRRLQKSREDAADEEASWEIYPEEIAGRPRDERLQAAVDAARAEAPTSVGRGKGTNKRPATQQGGGPAKKVRQTRLAPARAEVVDLEEEDDDDGLKFRRRRR